MFIFIKYHAMCKEIVLANMSWPELENRKSELDEWFKNHTCLHIDFNKNNRMYVEICTEIYKRKLNIQENDPIDFDFTTI